LTGKRSIAIHIRGKEYRIRSEDDAESLQEIATYVDETIARVEERTGAVDSLDVVMLTALNLARELFQAREDIQALGFGPERMRALIELAESALTAETH